MTDKEHEFADFIKDSINEIHNLIINSISESGLCEDEEDKLAIHLTVLTSLLHFSLLFISDAMRQDVLDILNNMFAFLKLKLSPPGNDNPPNTQH